MSLQSPVFVRPGIGILIAGLKISVLNRVIASVGETLSNLVIG
jgi:hypothetical protein